MDLELKQKQVLKEKKVKFCPFLTIANKLDAECIKSDCELYFYGHCSVKLIGMGMQKLFIERQKVKEQKKQEELKK